MRRTTSALACLVSATIATTGLVLVPTASAAVPVVPGEVGQTCSVEGQAGQSLRITGSHFEVEGTATVANYNDENLPLTQTIKEGATKNWNVGGSVNFDLLKLFHVTLSAGYQSSQTWEVGQTLGPYPVKPGQTGVLEYGFLNQTFEGTNLRCTGGVWTDTGSTFHGTIPRERHIRVSMRDNAEF
ncbi:hypothetical protein [Corynebacterium uterequi]|uniref:Secreted protein n=1 Tax=Corynebacterium uterequi TaxID=1072256 RepID=A0A0G3HDG3_9CORY|nr:hypothetical protein [Corynebacterium uterequi]AKK10735.1 hypothetical protein CUTER_03635 [Corynebacterium uterequi]